MEQPTRHPLRKSHEQKSAGQQHDVPTQASVDGTMITHPIDGSQYPDVIEEQEYADRRPSTEEQKPRFSYLHKENAQQEDDEQQE